MKMSTAGMGAIAATLVLGLCSPAHTATGPCGSKTGQKSTITKVLWVVMENHDYSSIYNNSNAPYETQIANACGLATNYHAVSHPSLPNYIALTSGKTWGITDDDAPGKHPLNVPSIFLQVYKRWRSYAHGYEETMPSNCYLSSSGKYAVKHNPWAYYVNGTVGPQRTQCKLGDVRIPTNVFTTGALYTDVRNGTLRPFSLVTPNLCNDMHDCSVKTGDVYLSHLIPLILAGPDYKTGHLAVVITFGEAGEDSTNHVYTAVISPFTAPGRKSATNYTHYSLLRTTEMILGLPLLGDAATATDMRAAFGLSVHHPNVSLPARGAFYYPWYPETWTVGGQYPHYHPNLGYYKSSSRSVADQHINWLDSAKVDVGIASWWGPNTHAEATRIPQLLDRTQTLGSPLKWTVYYEREGSGDPTVAQIQSDLNYLAGYAQSPSWAYVSGKPLIFVYSDPNDACAMVERWKQAASRWYVVLKVFPGSTTCTSQPDSWHQYSPVLAQAHQAGYSFSVSPGFWKADEAKARLTRDPTRFQHDVATMVASGEPWQLVTTFNEWGEGTGFEDAAEYGSTYRDILAGTY